MNDDSLEPSKPGSDLDPDQCEPDQADPEEPDPLEPGALAPARAGGTPPARRFLSAELLYATRGGASLIALFLAVFLATSPLHAQDSGERPQPSRPARAQPDPDVDRLIQRQLAWLGHQQKGLGTFTGDYPVAVTALAGMAFLGAGVEYNRGEHGAVLVGAVRYLLERSRSSSVTGYINDDDGANRSRMHGHAYAILFLAQVVGTIDNRGIEANVRRAIEDGIKVIERGQTERGGWGYSPSNPQDEASITVCCLQALRAAKDAGFRVDPAAVRSALDYLKKCAKPDGSFRYSLAGHQSQSSYELTAAAVSTLHAAGQYSSEEHQKGVDYMRRVLAQHKNPLAACNNYDYYGNLYAGQVYHQLGGEDWERWAPRARVKVMEWFDKEEQKKCRFGHEYAVAMSLLILEIPMGYLPIFER